MQIEWHALNYANACLNLQKGIICWRSKRFSGFASIYRDMKHIILEVTTVELDGMAKVVLYYTFYIYLFWPFLFQIIYSL